MVRAAERPLSQLALAFPLNVRTDEGGKNINQDQNTATQDAIVNFGDPVTLAGTANQVLVPDDTTIGKGGTITFIVNGGGHGIAIYPVSKNTTRQDITDQLMPMSRFVMARTTS